MSKPRSLKPNAPHEGAVPKAPRARDAREPSRGLATSRLEPSHQHQHAKQESIRHAKRQRKTG